MQVGEICHAILPPVVAYGEEGWPPRVPPNATIKMDLELLDFIDPEKLKAGAETAEVGQSLVEIVIAIALFMAGEQGRKIKRQED